MCVGKKRTGCICGLYTFLLMRILTKRPTAILRPFLESSHFFFSYLKKVFSRSLTKRPRAILRPFLESTRISLIQAPPWRRKLSLFLPGGLYWNFFLLQNLVTFWDKKIKKIFFFKFFRKFRNIFSKIWKKFSNLFFLI